MLPNADHTPAGPAKLTADQPVPCAVALDLGFPEARPGPRPCGVPGAAVPETTVDEDGHTEPGEYEVGADSARGAVACET